MNNNEENSPNQDPGQNQDKAWWEPERWADYCPDIASAGSDCCNGTDMRQAMSNCFSCCRYFLLLPVIFGISFLILGYYLNPEIIRVLWMITAGVVAAMGLFGVLVMRRFTARSWFSGCCGTWFNRKN